MLYREPKLLKGTCFVEETGDTPIVSVLYREPKLLKLTMMAPMTAMTVSFSALP